LQASLGEAAAEAEAAHAASLELAATAVAMERLAQR
jgi:hypothetical protein